MGGCSVNEKSWVGNGWVHRDLRKPWVLVGTRINCNQATPLLERQAARPEPARSFLADSGSRILHSMHAPGDGQFL